MGQSTPKLRELWKTYECAREAMVTIPFGPDRILVAPPTVDAWKALASVLAAHGYAIRTSDTDSYNCRTITGGTEKSLHAFGIALDVNWKTNPYIDHNGERDVRFSGKTTQDERALDVKHALADTDMTPAMIADVGAIKTKGGKSVFEWGGHWRSVKDCMHFELDVSPEELAAGVDWLTVKGQGNTAPPPASAGVAHRVIARDGLRLREGPGIQFAVKKTLAFGAVVFVMGSMGDWALVDLANDGAADGHMNRAYLQPI